MGPSPSTDPGSPPRHPRLEKLSMGRARRRCLLGGLLCLLLSPAVAAADESNWTRHTKEGLVAFQLRDYGKAEESFQAALKEAEKFGKNDSRLATTLNHLALARKAQGKYAEAEPLLERALEIRERTLGPEHPGVGTILNNLAEVYRSQGNYGEAEPLYRRAIEIDEKAQGPEHPSVAVDLNNLAVLYRGMGRYAEAESLYRRALTIWEKALGPNHTEVAGALENYARLLRLMGRGDEAEKFETRARAIRSKNASGSC